MIELLLADAIGKHPDITETTGINWGTGIPLALSLAIMLMFSFPPRTTIGIGKGQASIERQHKWLKLISASPKWFVLVVAASILGAAVRRYLGI